MYKNKLALAFTLFFIPSMLTSFTTIAADRYISDDLSVYLRRGPGAQYALVGSLKSGDKVSTLETSSDESYTKIKDDKGRIAWVESVLLTDSPSLKEQLPELEQELSTLRENANNSNADKQRIIDNYTGQLNTANQKITNLENAYTQLEQQTKEQALEIEKLNNMLDNDRQDLMLTWFTRGGLVAGIGLIIGIVLPIIIPRRRKKDRWMN